MDATCSNCLFFHKKDGWDGGECRRHSPVATTYGSPMWPHVLPEYWCGDFVNREIKQVEEVEEED